jgi:hypothetical protein
VTKEMVTMYIGKGSDERISATTWTENEVIVSHVHPEDGNCNVC